MKTMRMGDARHRPISVSEGDDRHRPYTSVVARLRIALLYLVSRRYLHSLVAIGTLTALTWWVMGRTPTDPVSGVDIAQITARNETLLLHLAAAMLASIIGIAAWTPFGETERVSPIVLPVMRAVHLFLMLAFGCIALGVVIANWRDVMPGVDLVAIFLRNALFLTGCVLIAGRIVDVRLSWLLPVMMGGVTIVGVLQRMARIERVEELWQGDAWNILALDQTHRIANALCLGVGLAGVAVYIRDGVRDTDEAE